MSISRSKKRGCFVFEFDRTINGQRIRVAKTLPRSWNQAQADAFDRKESGRLYAKAHGIGGSDHSIEAALAIYLRERIPELKHGKNCASELALMYPYYRDRPLSALTDVCKAYALKERDRLKPATIKNRIRYLTAACRFAWKRANMGEHDPAARVTVPAVRNERHEYVDRAGMLKLAKACQHRPTRAMIRLAFYTGMRAREILRAEVVGPNLMLRDTKNGDPRIIPIHRKITSAVNVKRPTYYVLNYWWRKARGIAGMPALHFHDLRHSAATAMLANNVQLGTIGAVLGHRSGASTRRYAHYQQEAMREAISMIGKRA
jgi:integrase